MALIKCPECKKKISDQCEKCPNCGYPIDKICEADENQITDIENVDDGTARSKKSFDIKSLLKKWWFWVAVGAVIVAIAVTTILLLNRDTKPKFDKDGNPMFVELTNEVYTNAEDYLGYHINIKGKVFQVMSDNGSVKGIQIWIDPDTCEQNMMIYYNTDVEVKQGDYIMCSGYIDSVTEYKNAYDAKLYAPLVISSDLVKATYIDVMSPTTATITPENLKQEKYGYSISIDKLEFAEKETRVYATVKNNGKALLNIGDAVIVQNGKQYNSTDNYEADYDEIPYEIVKGVSSSGIIVFPAISTNDFELTIDVHSDDYDEEIDKFVFKISADNKITPSVEKPSASNSSKPSNTSTATTTQTEKPKNRKAEAILEAENLAQTFFPTNRYFIRDVLINPSAEQNFEGFADSEADYAIENSSIDWNKHALGNFNNFLNNNPEYIKTYTPVDFNSDLQFLADDGFTEKEILYVRNNCNIDFNAKALAVILEELLESPPETTEYSPQSLKETTLYDFSDSQKNYAINNCGIDWNAEAVEIAEMLDLNLPNWSSEYEDGQITKEEMIMELKKKGFTEAQANYGVNNCKIDWESRKNN